MLAISGTARLRVLTRPRLLERVVSTSDMGDLVEKTEAQCSLKGFFEVIARSILVSSDIEEVQCCLLVCTQCTDWTPTCAEQELVNARAALQSNKLFEAFSLCFLLQQTHRIS